jgi:transketolase
LTLTKKRSTEELANAIRGHALRMVHRANASHIGTCLSMADLLAVLYGEYLRVDPTRPDWPDRDRFILSKGHGAAIAYATLAESGFFPIDWLDSYCQPGSPLAGHISTNGVPGVELSTGSLGHGLPVGCGLALAGKREQRPYRVCVLLSDGELDEGSNWEAILFAPQHRLDNLVVIVDYNKIQSLGNVSDIMELHPLADKFRAFRWAVREIDGHDHNAIRSALAEGPYEQDRPTAIIAHTVKGKGVSYMENELLWHYRSPNAELLKTALGELGIEG